MDRQNLSNNFGVGWGQGARIVKIHTPSLCVCPPARSEVSWWRRGWGNGEWRGERSMHETVITFEVLDAISLNPAYAEGIFFQ